MADVLLVQLHRRRTPPRERLATPVDYDVLAIGIDTRPQEQDRVVEDFFCARFRSSREQFVRELRRVLRSRDLRRVQATTDVDQRDAGARQFTGIRVGEPGWTGEPLIDAPELVYSREVCGR